MELDMKCCKKVLHITPTPLVNAPEKISEALNIYTDIESNVLVLKDYPNHLKNIFINQALTYFNTKDKYYDKFIIDKINDADIIHIHNFLPVSFEMFLLENLKNRNTKFIYHTHSVLSEGPIFYERPRSSKIEYSLKLSVAQIQPRMYENYKFAPNITLFKPNFRKLENNIPRILFSPAHKQTSLRFGQKYSQVLNEILLSMSRLNMIDLIDITGIRPRELYEIRKTTDISIDEIVTGGFHQISLEGLAAGNVVVNGADWFSMQVMKNISKNNEYPPFLIANEQNAKDKLFDLVKNIDMINNIKKESFEYFQKNLSPDFLINYYVKYYEEVMNG
jgi:hypothetical protein